MIVSLYQSCSPNAHIKSVFVDDGDIAKPLLCIFSRRKIKKNQEIWYVSTCRQLIVEGMEFDIHTTASRTKVT